MLPALRGASMSGRRRRTIPIDPIGSKRNCTVDRAPARGVRLRGGRRPRMNVRAIQALRWTLASDRPAYGLWITLEAPGVAEIATGLGLDWIVIDAEHGHLDWR